MPSVRNPYQEHLNSERWQALRAAALARDGRRCKRCGSRGCQHNPLHVHHLSYRHFGDERLAEVLTLCAFCHARTHKRRAPRIQATCQACAAALHWARTRPSGRGRRSRQPKRRLAAHPEISRHTFWKECSDLDSRLDQLLAQA